MVSVRPWARRAAAVALGLALDRALGEPPDRVHPVAAFGSVMNKLEGRVYGDDRARGVGYGLAGAGLGLVAGRLVRSTAIATGGAVAGRMLRQATSTISDSLAADDLEQARLEVSMLVGRDPSELDESGIAAAAIESLFENTVDAVVAPVFWALVAGAPGVLAHRAVNTMDAMVGHHSERYERFGWCAARLDDVANWIPARIAAALTMAAAPARAESIRRVVGRDAAEHPSPNAGVAESAAAAALGIELGGSLRYGDRIEHRPRLGDGPRPVASDIAAAVQLADRIEKILAVLLIGIAVTGVRR